MTTATDNDDTETAVAIAGSPAAAEVKFATVFGVCPDLIAITSKATGRFLEVNPAFERIMGFSRAEAIGRTSAELGTWASPEERGRMLEAMKGGSRLENFETGFRRRNGESFTALMSTESAVLAGEECLIIIARDISDRKREERVLRQTVDELQRSNLELERFAYVAAHDLQEPCRTVHSFAQLLKRRHSAQLGPDAMECLDFLTSGAQRMRDLINGVLRYSRAGVGVVRVIGVDMNELVAGVVADLAGVLEAGGGRVEVRPLPQVRGDPAQLRRLFLNLIGNGLKFQQDGAEPCVIVTGETLDGGGHRFQVADNGIGIADEHLERIFSIFTRLHGPDRYPGAGIGLSVAKRIVEAHGGTIAARSEPGHGTVFVFDLAT